MYIRHLSLQNYRSWPELTIDLEPGITVFRGPNGYGKTNIVEAVDYLAHLSSHRVAGDQPLVREGCAHARVSATAVNQGRELTAHILINAQGANRAHINRSACRSPRELAGIVQTVLFSPEDLALVKGEPAERRKYLDSLLESRFPRWAGMRTDYEKILRQRNALLKKSYGARNEPNSSLTTLDTWDLQLASAGAAIMARRIALTETLNPYLTQAYADIAPESRPASMSYGTKIENHLGQAGLTAKEVTENLDEATPIIEAVLLQQLADRRKTDIERGTSTIGPHRDDLNLYLGGQPTKGYASHGESWSFALAMRLASFEWHKQRTEPILILDDVFAELDPKRRKALAHVATNAEQTLITAADELEITPTQEFTISATTTEPRTSSLT